MKKLVAFAISAILSIQAYGQDYYQLALPNEKSSAYRQIPDLAAIDTAAVERLRKNLGLELVHSRTDHQHYRGRRGGLGQYSVIFSYNELNFRSPVSFNINSKPVELEPYEWLAYYGFTASLRENRKVDRRFSEYLVSAYQQETDAAYLADKSNFVSIPKLDKGIFWKRNMLNMGYGISYVAKDNPFMAHKGLIIGFGYAWEALHYIPIVGGPFFGKTPSDRINTPIIGLASLLLWKTVFMGAMVGNEYIRHNRTLHNAGYNFPREIVAPY